MMKNDSIWTGIIGGLVIPVLGTLVFYGILEGMEAIGIAQTGGEHAERRTLFLVGLCFNLIALQVFQVRKWPEAVRGILFVTGIYAVAWFVLYGKDLL